MALNGHVYYIEDAKAAFIPVILSNQPPTSGFVPWPNCTVEVSYQWEVAIFAALTLYSTTTTTGRDGSFSFPAPPAIPLGPVKNVFLKVTSGVPVYRTGFISYPVARDRALDFWIYPDQLKTSEGITAGTVAQQISGQGLPGNTNITSGGPYGLNFNGSQGQVDVNFNIAITPDVSPNLADFLDLAINGWNIHVGWPTDWFESANDVLNSVKSGIAAAGASVNKAVLAQMGTILAEDEGITGDLATNFLDNEVSVTFYGVGYPNAPQKWGVNDTTNSTVVLIANPCIGYPRNF